MKNLLLISLFLLSSSSSLVSAEPWIASPLLVECPFKLRTVNLVTDSDGLHFITYHAGEQWDFYNAQLVRYTKNGLSSLPKFTWLNSEVETVDTFEQITTDLGDKWYWKLYIGYDQSRKPIATYAEAFGPEKWEVKCSPKFETAAKFDPPLTPPGR